MINMDYSKEEQEKMNDRKRKRKSDQAGGEEYV